MPVSHLRKQLTLLLLLACLSGQAFADEIRVAVASNFSLPIKSIVERFEKDTGHHVSLAFGSSGKHYAQIINGAPFDIFFSADAERAKRLEESGVALKGSRFTYAIGKFVLWSPLVDKVDTNGEILASGKFKYIAIANPKFAPYGAAAVEMLKASRNWDNVKARIVRGENIGQTFQFVKSGSAELGFIALSQIMSPGHTVQGSYWEPPSNLYGQIEQQAVVLRENSTVREFLEFFRGQVGKEILLGYGYTVP